MSLLSKLREKQAGKLATATPATFATQAGERGRTVASVAGVAVANPRKPIPKLIPALPAKLGAGDMVSVSRWWLIHYPDRDPLEVACCPDATNAEILERHPDAVAAEPFTPTTRQPTAPMTAEEGTAIRAWLVHIEETDPGIIAEVMDKCHADPGALAYFLKRADELPSLDNDRRRCSQCTNLSGRGICLAAKRGDFFAGRNYQPVCDLPRRCESYSPGPDDPDRRHGRQRWPGLLVLGVNHGE